MTERYLVKLGNWAYLRKFEYEYGREWEYGFRLGLLWGYTYIRDMHPKPYIAFGLRWRWIYVHLPEMKSVFIQLG